ncbi:MAG: hypothetical protein ACI4I1_11980 [Oscillospiraceae bacterium]
MENSIFRKKSMERISSPEQLNDYIKVANPGVWILLGAIVILLAGICVWGVYGRLDTVVRGAAVSENGTLVCYVTEENAAKIRTGMKLSANGTEFTVSEVSSQPVSAGSVLDDYALHVGDFQPEDWVYSVTALSSEGASADGVYIAEIVVDSVSPKIFVIN